MEIPSDVILCANVIQVLDLSDLNLTKLPSIDDLALYIDLQSIYKIDINNNQLETIYDLSLFPNLTELHCDNNIFTELPDLSNTKIKVLSCIFNKLIKLPKLPITIQVVRYDNNNIT